MFVTFGVGRKLSIDTVFQPNEVLDEGDKNRHRGVVQFVGFRQLNGQCVRADYAHRKAGEDLVITTNYSDENLVHVCVETVGDNTHHFEENICPCEEQYRFVCGDGHAYQQTNSGNRHRHSNQIARLSRLSFVLVDSNQCALNMVYTCRIYVMYSLAIYLHLK